MSTIRKDDDSGFSILELVVWLVIAGILIGAALVGYQQYRAAGRIHEMKSLVRYLSIAADASFADTGSFPSASTSGAGVLTSSGWSPDVQESMDQWVDKGGTIDLTITAGFRANIEVTHPDAHDVRVSFSIEDGALVVHE